MKQFEIKEKYLETICDKVEIDAKQVKKQYDNFRARFEKLNKKKN